MRKMFRNNLCAAALFIATTAFAGDLQTDIRTVENFTTSVQTLQLNFVQKTFIKVLNKNIEKPGTLFLQKGGKFRIEYTDKSEKLFVCNGEILWMLDPANPVEPQSYHAHGGQIPEEVFTLLSDGKSLEKSFKVTELPANTDKISLRLQPRKKTSYQFLEGLFAKNGAPENLKIVNTSGNVTEYQFSHLKKDQPFSKKLFDLSSGKATPDTLPQN